MLRDAGLGTIPGTAAEILDDDVREILSHKKVDVRTWVEIITTAHELGVRRSSTVMYGHIETPEHVARHIALLARSQKQTGGFTEFVPLRFIHTLHRALPEGPGRLRRRTARSTCACTPSRRLMLRGWIDNLQTSWVKLGTELAQLTPARRLQRLRRHADGGVDLQVRRRRRRRVSARVATIRALIDGVGPHSRTTDDDCMAGSRPTGARNRVTVLAGGVGAARFLRGLLLAS